MASRIRMLARNRSFQFLVAIILIIVLMGAFGPYLVRHEPAGGDAKSESGLSPSREHLLGTQANGYDVLSRLVHATRQSTYVGLIVAVIATLVAILIGGVGGYIGGLVDESTNMAANVFLLLPALPLVILLSTQLGGRTLLAIGLIVVLVQWAPWARAIRSQVLSLKERDFVDLAIVSGKGNMTILFKEILPNMLAYIVITFASIFASALITVAGLSMVGFGPESLTLGRMLYLAQDNAAHLPPNIQWWWMMPPGIVLVVYAGTIISLVSVIDDVLNPRLRTY